MKKQGFTLIELLAVIVVLAVIALISIPIITSVIDKVKLGALKDSVYGLIEASELYLAKNINKVEDYTIFEIENGKQIGENKLDVKSKGTGKLVLFKDSSTILCYQENEYFVIKQKDNEELTTGKGTCTIENETALAELASNEKINLVVNLKINISENVELSEEKNKLLWTIESGNDVLKIENNTVTALTVGEAKIVGNSTGKSKVTFNITVKPPISPREDKFVIDNLEDKPLTNYFIFTNSSEVLCKVGDTDVETTYDLINLGLLDKYKVDCGTNGYTASTIIEFNKVYIFNSGKLFSEMSAGYTRSLSQVYSGSSYSGNFYISGNNTILTLSAEPGSCSKIFGTSNKKIDFTNYSKLGVEIYSSSYGGQLGITNSLNTNGVQTTSIASGLANGTIVYLNIDDANRTQFYPYMIIHRCHTGSSQVTSNIIISKWWIEK